MPLSWSVRAPYSVGHFLNDACASIWFSYVLIYLTAVLGISQKLAGVLLLTGQVFDAMATPTVGILSDLTTKVRYGQRKLWHLIGTIMVAGSFPFVLGTTWWDVVGWGKTAYIIYYGSLIAIFQLGWAATQVSHLALIPELTDEESERWILNSARYGFTIGANLFTFGVAWFLLNSSSGDDIGPEDMYSFAHLVYIVVGAGMVLAIYFHCGVREPSCEQKRAKKEEGGHMMVKWHHWFKDPLFFQVGTIYMCTRLVVNVSQVYIPLYLLHSANMDKTSIAEIPAIVFLSGLVTTVVSYPINERIGRRWTYFIGVVAIVGSSAAFYFLPTEYKNYTYGISALLGVGCTTLLVTALEMISALIGDSTESGAFVYGALSLTDKASNGAAIIVIQFIAPTDAAADGFYRTVMGFVPAIAAILALASLISMSFCGGFTVRKVHAGDRGGRDPLLRTDTVTSIQETGSLGYATFEPRAATA